MKKVKIFIVASLICFPLSAVAFEIPEWLMNPVSTSDGVRTAITTAVGLWHHSDGPKMGMTMNVTQEEVGALQEGDNSYQVPEGTGTASKAGDIPTESFEYVKKNILDASKMTPYTPLNDKVKAGGDMVAAVKELFFIENESDATDEKRAEIKKHRDEYLTALGKTYVKLAYETQQKLIKDFEGVGSDINGDGVIGTISGGDVTWQAVNRALIADIALQIELMELDAARFLSVQPYVIMSETRTTGSNE